MYVYVGACTVGSVLKAGALYFSHKLCLEVKPISESVRSSGSSCCLTFTASELDDFNCRVEHRCCIKYERQCS